MLPRDQWSDRRKTGLGSRRKSQSLFPVPTAKLAVVTGLVLLGQAGMAAVAAAETVPGDLVLVSASTGGEPGNGSSSYGVSTSADGRYVAFASMATNFDTGDQDTVVEVFVKNLGTGELRLASQTADRMKGNSISDGPS